MQQGHRAHQPPPSAEPPSQQSPSLLALASSPGTALTKKHIYKGKNPNQQTYACQLERTVMPGLAFLKQSLFSPFNTAANAYFKLKVFLSLCSLDRLRNPSSQSESARNSHASHTTTSHTTTCPCHHLGRLSAPSSSMALPQQWKAAPP